MSAALAFADDDLQMPRRARHLHLVALNGQILASQANRSRSACMRVGTSALLPDLLDRATRIALPDGNVTSMEYGFGSDAGGAMRFQTVTTDANGNHKQSYRDVRELITTVVEENRAFGNDGKPLGNGKTPVATRYNYDPPEASIDAKINEVSYDSNGRTLTILAPQEQKNGQPWTIRFSYQPYLNTDAVTCPRF